MWSLSVPVSVKSWPKVKLGQVEVDSNIAQDHFHGSQKVISAHYLPKFIWYHARFRRYTIHSNTLIWPLKVIQGQRSWGQLKYHIYDLLYVFHINLLKRTIIERSSKPVFWQFISTLIGQLYAKIEKKLLNSFGANGPQVQKGPNLTFLTLKNDLERFNQIYPSICDLCHPKEAPC